MEVVAPSSAPILVIVARSGTVSEDTPSPAYSTIFPTPPLTERDFEHLENHILGGYPGGKLACQVDAQHLRHGDVISAAAHGNRHVKTARAHCQHTNAAAGRGVAVRADQCFSRDAKTLQMHLMANAVSGTGKADTVLFCNALNKAVVVGVLKTGLQGVCGQCMPHSALF